MKAQLRGLGGPLIKLAIFAVVTIIATGILAFSIANTSLGGGTKFYAIFSDATQLNPGDEIRIAGVRVGQVKTIEIYDDTLARVEFQLTDRDWLPESVTATLKFRNLVGQRYIALEEGDGNQESRIHDGATIPLDRTKPALNLTVLFDGFRPLFGTLNPDEVNKLSYQIIQVFQGEGTTMAELVRNTASLTNTIADKDQVIGAVIDNLNGVLAAVNRHDEGLDALIVNTQELVTGLANDRTVVGNAVSSLSTLTDATADVLEPTRPAIQGSITALDTLAGTLNEQNVKVDSVLKTLPLKLEKLIRTASMGSWFQYYLCGIDVQVGPGINSDLNVPPILAGLPTLNQPLYTNAATRCRNEGAAE